MKTLTDKAIQFRTYPVVPRKRVTFDEKAPVITSLFESDRPAFNCQGGYFTHHTYNLLDFFVSYWFEILNGKWKAAYGSNLPGKPTDLNINKLYELSPVLRMRNFDTADLQNNLIDLFQQLRDYSIIEAISDVQMKKHPALKRMSSAKLNEVIDKSSKARIKTVYSLRMIKEKQKRKFLGWEDISNLEDQYAWSSLFDFKLLEEKRAKDGRVIERIYKFGFNDLLGIAMIHNTICSGTWSVNPKFYTVSGDAQLLYRYLVITGSRFYNHRIDYIGHRIGWREKQKSRLAGGIGRLFEELKQAGLIVSYNQRNNSHGNIYFSFEIHKPKVKSKG